MIFPEPHQITSPSCIALQIPATDTLASRGAAFNSYGESCCSATPDDADHSDRTTGVKTVETTHQSQPHSLRPDNQRRLLLQRCLLQPPLVYEKSQYPRGKTVKPIMTSTPANPTPESQAQSSPQYALERKPMDYVDIFMEHNDITKAWCEHPNNMCI